MIEIFEWLEATAFASIARESLYGFQVLVALHLLGLIFSVGLLLWVDLRMLGFFMPEQPLTALYRALSKWFIAGFCVMFVTGAALFAGFATSAYANTFFRVKLAIILLAGINAAVFHISLKRIRSEADRPAPPGFIRLTGALSILFWLSVIFCGRMMSYTLF